MRVKLPRGTDHIFIRPFQPGDEGFVYNSWCNQIRSQNPFVSMTADEFRDHKHTVIEGLVANCTTLIACEDGHPTHLLGFCCSKDDTLHFLYVKAPLRKHGIGTALMRASFAGFKRIPLTYSYPTRYVHHYAGRWRISHDPKKRDAHSQAFSKDADSGQDLPG